MVLKEFLHKISQKFWTGDREVLKAFFHKIFHTNSAQLILPLPHANPHPLNIENSRRVSYILQSYFAKQSISQPAG